MDCNLIFKYYCSTKKKKISFVSFFYKRTKFPLCNYRRLVKRVQTCRTPISRTTCLKYLTNTCASNTPMSLSHIWFQELQKITNSPKTWAEPSSCFNTVFQNANGDITANCLKVHLFLSETKFILCLPAKDFITPLAFTSRSLKAYLR